MSSHYERLSFLDNSFLALESRTTHFHVASMLVFEGGAIQTDEGGVDVERIKRFIESRLHMIPRYRQRLAHVPFERYPVWVDDAHFNIDYHIRHSSLPKPGDFDQLKRLMSRLSSQQLDRSKPLWELNVVEGLQGDRFAIISKIHHAMIDGISGVDLMAVLLNLAPTDDFEPGPEYEPRDAPEGAELVLREAARRAGRVAAALRSVRTLSDDVQSIAMQGARRLRAMSYSLGSGWLTPATKTPLNGEIGPNRRFGTLRTQLEDVKEIKNSLGGSVNDVILATVAGGVRRFLKDVRGFDVDGIDFRAMAPVSVRAPSQRGTLGNQVAMWLVSLPVGESDPARRLDAVKEATLELKMTDQALGAATLVQLSSGAPVTLLSMASRLASGARPFNLTVTNVPGPQFPLYLLGAKLAEQYPLVPLWHGHGVGVALFSYNGEISWGFNADYDIMEDLDLFVASIQDEFAALLEAAREASSAAAAAENGANKPASRKAATKKPSTANATKGTSSRATTSRSKATTPKKSSAEKPTTTKAATTAKRATTAKKTTARRTTTAKKTTAARTSTAKKTTTSRGNTKSTGTPKKRPPMGT